MPPEIKRTVDRMLVRDALGFARIGQDVLEALDRRLGEIPNNVSKDSGD